MGGGGGGGKEKDGKSTVRHPTVYRISIGQT